MPAGALVERHCRGTRQQADGTNANVKYQKRRKLHAPRSPGHYTGFDAEGFHFIVMMSSLLLALWTNSRYPVDVDLFWRPIYDNAVYRTSAGAVEQSE